MDDSFKQLRAHLSFFFPYSLATLFSLSPILKFQGLFIWTINHVALTPYLHNLE